MGNLIRSSSRKMPLRASTRNKEGKAKGGPASIVITTKLETITSRSEVAKKSLPTSKKRTKELKEKPTIKKRKLSESPTAAAILALAGEVSTATSLKSRKKKVHDSLTTLEITRLDSARKLGIFLEDDLVTLKLVGIPIFSIEDKKLVKDRFYGVITTVVARGI